MNISPMASRRFLTRLARTPGLRVAARTSAFIPGRNRSVQHIGDTESGALPEGTCGVRATNSRITAQLISVDGFTCGRTTYDHKSGMCSRSRPRVAQRVQEVVEGQPMVASAPTPRSPGRENLEAYDLFARAVSLGTSAPPPTFSAPWVCSNKPEKIPSLRRPTLDFPPATRCFRAIPQRPCVKRIPKARAAARRLSNWMAVIEAHGDRGYRAKNEWNLEEAEQSFNPRCALIPITATAITGYALLLRDQGRMEQSLPNSAKQRRLIHCPQQIQANIGYTPLLRRPLMRLWWRLTGVHAHQSFCQLIIFAAIFS